MDAQAALAAACLPPLAAACAADVRRRIIPDWTCLAIAALGAAAATVTSGALASHLAAGVASGMAGAALAWHGLWGWGDAKLLAAAGIAAGPEQLAPLLLAASLCGAGIAAVLLLLRPWARGLRALPKSPRWLRAEARRLRSAPSTPYGVAIAAGLLAALLT